MNTKTLLAPALGTLFWAASTLALAGRLGQPPTAAARIPRLASRQLVARRPALGGVPRSPLVAAPPRVYWRPAPVWHPKGYVYGGSGWAPRPYNRDGVTIILRGRIN